MLAAPPIYSVDCATTQASARRGIDQLPSAMAVNAAGPRMAIGQDSLWQGEIVFILQLSYI